MPERAERWPAGVDPAQWTTVDARSIEWVNPGYVGRLKQDAAICGHCRRPAVGYANANGIRLCHTGTVPMEDEPADCYRLVVVAGHAADGTCCQDQR